MTSIQTAGATAVLSILTLSPQAGATDLLIQGGTVVTAEGERKADIRIRGETIDEIGSLERVETDTRVLDASGLLILPGGVDPHVHLTYSEEFAFAHPALVRRMPAESIWHVDAKGPSRRAVIAQLLGCMRHYVAQRLAIMVAPDGLRRGLRASVAPMITENVTNRTVKAPPKTGQNAAPGGIGRPQLALRGKHYVALRGTRTTTIF